MEKHLGYPKHAVEGRYCGYTSILKLGTREGDNAKMVRIELV